MCLSVIPSSKTLKEGGQIGSKFKRRFGTQEGHSALLECRSSHEKCGLAQIASTARGLLD